MGVVMAHLWLFCPSIINTFHLGGAEWETADACSAEKEKHKTLSKKTRLFFIKLI
jgi:hypothetical protein